MAYELIETIEVGAGGASVLEFQSIPQDGVDLVLVMSPDTSLTANASINITFNGDTGTNYNWLHIRSDGSGLNNDSQTSDTEITLSRAMYGAATADTFASCSVYVSNYTSSASKSVSADFVNENNGSTAYMGIVAGSYTPTAAITTVTATPANGNFVQYSTASLFKIY